MTARLSRAKVASAGIPSDNNSGEVQRRVAHLLRELLASHAEALLALLAEQAVAPQAQIERMNALVGALVGVKFENELRVNGRNIPLRFDPTSTPPTIQLHRTLIQGIEDAEVLRAFHAPIADILGISPVGVGLVLGSQDTRQLKTLVAQVARRAGAGRVRITQVEAIVEQRLQLFNARLDAVADQFGESLFWLRVGEDDFKAKLAEQPGGWPDWDDVRGRPFIRGLIDELHDCIEVRQDMPSAEVLVELCWESLELSAQSFLRHAAQTLRAHEANFDLVEALKKLAGAIEIEEDAAFYSIDVWPIYRDLGEAWDGLFQAEQAVLAGAALSGAATRRKTPVFSVLDRPIDSLGICEPSTLPWEAPLLAWTMREHHGLRDLLVGLRNSLGAHGAELEELSIELSQDSAEAPLDISAPRGLLQIRVAERGQTLPDGYGALLGRAMNVSHAAMAARFEQLDEASKTRALRTLRSAYDGYFGGKRALWARRFQAWEKWSSARAFRVLSAEVRHVAGASMLFDPFETPEGVELSPVPKFILIAPRPQGLASVSVAVPIAALKRSLLGAPIRVRLVDVPAQGACVWAGDLPVDMATVEEYPTRAVLESVDADAVRLLIQDANARV